MSTMALLVVLYMEEWEEKKFDANKKILKN